MDGARPVENMGPAFLTPPAPSADGLLARVRGNYLITSSALDALRPGPGVMLKLFTLNGTALFGIFVSYVLEVAILPSRADSGGVPGA